MFQEWNLENNLEYKSGHNFYLIHWAVLNVTVVRVLDWRLAYYPGWENDRSTRHSVNTDPAASSSFSSTATTSPFSGVILHGYETDGPLPSTAKSKDAWSHKSTLPIFRNGVAVN